MENQKIEGWLRLALAFWAVASLSFMMGMGIGSGLFVLVSLVYLFKKPGQWRYFGATLYVPASLFFFFACVLSAVCALLWPPLGLPLEPFREFQKFHYFVLPIFGLLAWTVSSGPGLEFEEHIFWQALYWMGLFVSLVGICQFWGSYLFPEAWLAQRFFRVIPTELKVNLYHAQGLMFFHLSFASVISFVFCYSSARLLWPLLRDQARNQIAWAILALCSGLALFFSFSRISWVALPLMIITLGFLKRPRWGVLSIFFVGGLGALLVTYSSSLRARWNLGLNSIFERKQVWAGAWEMVVDRTLTGVGFGKTGYYSVPYETKALGHAPEFSSHAHNNLLDITAGTGLVGLAAFLFWWGLLAVYAFRAYRAADETKRWLPAACLAALVGFQVNGLTQVNFFDAKSQHSLMLWAGLVLALEWRRRQRAAKARS